VDKDAVLKAVGELYLENQFLNSRVEKLTKELDQLHKLVEELQQINTG